MINIHVSSTRLSWESTIHEKKFAELSIQRAGFFPWELLNNNNLLLSNRWIYEPNTITHQNIWTHTHKQNPQSKHWIILLRDKTWPAACFCCKRRDTVFSLLLKRCAGMYCTCNDCDLWLFLASVGSGNITLRLHSVCLAVIQLQHMLTEYAYLYIYLLQRPSQCDYRPVISQCTVLLAWRLNFFFISH